MKTMFNSGWLAASQLDFRPVEIVEKTIYEKHIDTNQSETENNKK